VLAMRSALALLRAVSTSAELRIEPSGSVQYHRRHQTRDALWAVPVADDPHYLGWTQQRPALACRISRGLNYGGWGRFSQSRIRP
jgi:hypothetical protein